MFKFIKKAYTKHLDNLVEKYWNIYHFDMEPGHQSYNNEGDAFKHCMFMAELTFWLGIKIAKYIGDKHEDRPDNPPKEKEMDLHNNEYGRKIGKDYRRFFFINLICLNKTYNGIAEDIMHEMGAGNLITKV